MSNLINLTKFIKYDIIRKRAANKPVCLTEQRYYISRRVDIIAVTLLIVAGLASVFLAPQPAYATDVDTPSAPLTQFAELGNCGKQFLTFQPWFNGICDNDTKTIASPTEVGGIAPFVWIIVLNVLAILLQIVGYVSIGFIIWGGFLFILAQGEPSKIVAARKTIINAVIGLVIAVFANIIINTIVNFIAPGESI